MTTTLTSTAGATRSVSTVLLTRRALVHVPPPSSDAAPADPAGVTLLEADLLERGYLLSAPLRAALGALDAPALVLAGATLLGDVDTAVGAHVRHQPLFRAFPDAVPQDTVGYFVDRVVAFLAQAEHAPCVLCGTDGQVHPVSPCAHLVCRACFDGANHSACPICHRRISPADPFLLPAAHRPAPRHVRTPDRLRVLGLSADADADLATELATLLARAGAPTPADVDDLRALLATRTRTDLAWLPAAVPSREAKAHLLAWLLDDPAAHPATVPAATGLVDTATDVLRLLAVRSGGDAGLVDRPRFAPVPRPLRRALLALLNTLDPERLTEDLIRHRSLWRRAAYQLHPFEHARHYPLAATAFAALRGTHLNGDTLTDIVFDCVPLTRSVTVTGDGHVRARTHSATLEAALAAGDVTTALALLTARPGELLRRVDQLLRVTADDPAGTDAVLAALPAAARTASVSVLLSCLGQLRTRHRAGERRVFFPKGGNAKAHVVDDPRAPLPASVVARAVAALTGAVLTRAAALPAVDVALLDADLDDVIAPFTQRSTSRALVTLPRGSSRPLPDGATLRLFLHWMEADCRVDLDLSVAFFDAHWQHVGTCDFTELRFAGASAAVHSGDLTSAPAPAGSSEFIDLDVPLLRAHGVRYAVPAVFSYNNVAFDDMAEAFAGVMAMTEPDRGEVFQARAVEQRFDLAGRARASVPMVLDLEQSTLRWLDVVQGVTGTHHAVARHGAELGLLGQALTGLFASGARVSLGEVARWHAAARAGTVLVRGHEGGLARFTRRPGEDPAAFADRIGAGTDADGPAAAAEAASAALAFLVRGDVDVADGASVYALHPAQLDPTRVRLLEAVDVAGSLTG